jgi:hypothetical protein
MSGGAEARGRNHGGAASSLLPARAGRAQPPTRADLLHSLNLARDFSRLVLELNAMGMSDRAAASFSMLMRDAGLHLENVEFPCLRLPFPLTGEGHSKKPCWRLSLVGMRKPEPLRGCRSEVSSLRLFHAPEQRLFLPILNARQLIGASPEVGPGVLGEGYFDPSDTPDHDRQKALEAVNAAGDHGIIFEATVRGRIFERQRTPGTVSPAEVRDSRLFHPDLRWPRLVCPPGVPRHRGRHHQR